MRSAANTRSRVGGCTLRVSCSNDVTIPRHMPDFCFTGRRSRSDAWQNEVESWGGTAPDWYGDHPGVETGIPHEMWQSLLFWKIVDPTVPPAAVYSFDAINLLLAEFPAELPPESRQVAAQMVVAFFTTLERHRYLDGPIKKSRKLGALSWYRTLADSAPSAEPSWNANPSL